jgi:hypothetical protein
MVQVVAVAVVQAQQVEQVSSVHRPAALAVLARRQA